MDEDYGVKNNILAPQKLKMTSECEIIAGEKVISRLTEKSDLFLEYILDYRCAIKYQTCSLIC